MDIETIPLVILHELLREGEQFYDNLEIVNAGMPDGCKTKKTPLRVRDPWDG